jgi:hypothetical protein
VEPSKTYLPEMSREAVGAFAGPALARLTARRSSAGAGTARDQGPRQSKLRHAVGRLIQQHRAAAALRERRGQATVDFLQPVRVWTEDGREFTLLSHDLSVTGIRVIAPRSLLGQKLRVLHPGVVRGEPTCLVIRVVWSSAVGDELFENGGIFLDVVPGAPARLRLFSAGAEG